MKFHNLSYEPKNAVFIFNGLIFSVMVFTHENSYLLDENSISSSSDDHSLNVVCDKLAWAGGQEKCEGGVSISAVKTATGTQIKINAGHPNETVRCVKLLLKGIRKGVAVGLRTPEGAEKEKKITGEGLLMRYPNGFDGLYTPLLVIKHSLNDFTFFRSLDNVVRPKTFVVLNNDDCFDIELIFEERAIDFRNSIDVPVWEIGKGISYEEIMSSQAMFIEKTYGLVPWEERQDVPRWMRDISLIASIHCQHWTGYIFNNYEQVLDNLKWITKRIAPERVLAYLPGWEGRYYWQYGDYRPDPRMGGEEGFKRLIDGAKELGVHVMPMFMINGANPRTEGFSEWGEPSIYVSAGGFKQIWGSCDWDTSRHYDHNCGLPLNPGAPLWQDRLVRQINNLIERFGFDAVFLDLAAVYINDPRYDTYLATIDIARRIREKNPDVLISGEGWYDAISLSIPLTQPALVPPGDTVWSDGPYAPLFDKYNRCFAHLGTGDPSRGSTGVFEWGYNKRTQRVPLRKGIIPTVTIVDGTIENAPDKVEEIIEDAKQYEEMFLKQFNK